MAENEYMMPPLEVYAADSSLNRLTGSIPYTSLTWHRRYYSCGEFSMTVPASIYSPDWFMIDTDMRPETGIVQKVEYTDDPTYGNDDTVTVSGFFLESIMNRRTFLDETPEEVTYRYYVDPPAPPRKELTDAELYVDSTGKYWYPTPSGQSYGVIDGSSDPLSRTPGGTIEISEDGSATVVSGGQTIELTKVNAIEQINSYCYTDGSTTELNRVQNFGTSTEETTHQIAFDDGFGHVYYHDSEQNVMKYATGVTSKEQDNYVIQKRKWEATTDNGWVTVTETVKGPWQVTSVEDMTTAQDNIARCVGWAQMYFQNEMLFVEPDITGESKITDPSFTLLGDLLYQELQTVGASFRVEFDFINAQFVFSVWKGTDRTQAQTQNPWAVFSDTWGSLYGYDAQTDSSNYRNKCYVLYEYDEPTGWQSNGAPDYVPVYEESSDGTQGSQSGWKVPYTTKRGFITVRLDDDLDDRETYLDLRNDPPACDSEWEREFSGTETPDLPAGIQTQYENFPASLQSQGMTLLQNEYAVIKSLDTGDLRMNRYLKDYDLGDKVDQMVSKIGLVETARITGVEETYESGTSDIKLEIGEQSLDVIKKARLV